MNQSVPDRKYLRPVAYLNKLKHLVARLILNFGVSIPVITIIDSYHITFLANSYLEYLFRAQNSYQREKVTMYWLREVIEPKHVVYDVGANVGAYSLFAGYKVHKSGGRVYAFEPSFFNFNSLSRNIEANQLVGTIIPYPIALGESSREGKLFLSSTITGSALHGLDRSESEGKEFSAEFFQGIYVVALDEFCFQPGVEFPNHIKIDVDGGESGILCGMQSVMRDNRLKSIMIEINRDVSDGEIEEEIISCGLKLQCVEKWPRKNSYNKLFVRQQSVL